MPVIPTAQPKRVALYARVSTLDKGQDLETQLRPLREYAVHRGFAVVEEYVDQASGTSEERTHYKRMMAAAKKRQFDVVLVWRYDRFARSTQALVNALKEFQSLGVDFISYQENIDTTTPTGELIFHVMASLAQFESALISQRARRHGAGQGPGQARGPSPLAQAKQEAIAQLLREGISMNQVSKQLTIAYGNAYNYAQKLKNA